MLAKDELCLLCCSPGIAQCSPQSISNKDFLLSPAGTTRKEEQSLEPHLHSIFVLRKLLHFPKSRCGQLLRETGLDPGKWFVLCENCSGLVSQAVEVHLQVVRLTRQLEEIQEKLKRRLRPSLEDGTQEGRDDGGIIGRSVRDLIREFYKGTGTARRFQVGTRNGGEHRSKKAILQDKRAIRGRQARKVGRKPMKNGPEIGEAVVKNENEPDSKLIVKTEPSLDDIDLTNVECIGCTVPPDFKVKTNEPNSDEGSGMDEDWFPPEDLEEVTKEKMRKRGRKRAVSTSQKGSGDGPSPTQSEGKVPPPRRRRRQKKKVIAVVGKSKSKKSPYPRPCEVCNVPQSSVYNYLAHMKDHSNPEYVQNFSCDRCPFVGRHRSMMLKHYPEIHGVDHPDKFWRCDKCDFKSLFQYKMKRHQMVHQFNEQHFEVIEATAQWTRCKLCGKEDSILRMHRHLEEVHSLVSDRRKENTRLRFLCHICEKSYVSRTKLETHIAKAHKEGNVDVVNKLETEDSTPSSTNAQRVVCDECGMSFYSTAYWRGHYRRVHMKRSDSLLAEEKKKRKKPENPKFTTCKHCGFKCLYRQMLHLHYKTVHADRLSKCDLCEATYTNPGDVIKHKRRVHKGALGLY